MIRLIKFIYRILFPLSTEEMYRRMGVQIGKNCKIQNGVIIDHSHYWHVTIGNYVTLAPHVHILAHDTSTKLPLGYTKIANVNIEDNVFVGAQSVILPGITIGENAIVGAGSVVSKSIPANTVYAGNPAKFICTLDEYLDKQKQIFEHSPHFGEEYTVRQQISKEKQEEMKVNIGDGVGFVI